MICLEAHGQAVPVDDLFNTLAGDLPHPPAHFRCRSMLDMEVVLLSELTRANVDGNRFVASERARSADLIRQTKKRLGTNRYAARKEKARSTVVPRLIDYVDVRSA